MVVALFFLALTVVLFILHFTIGDGDCDDGYFFGGIASFMPFVICIGIFLSTYACSLDNYAKLLTYHEMMPYYEKVISQTESVAANTDTEGEAAIGSGLYNMQHSTNMAARLLEIRDYMRWYRENKRRYQMYCDRWYAASG